MGRLYFCLLFFTLLNFHFSYGILNTANVNSNTFLFNGDFEFVDLSHLFDKNTVYWPDSQNFTFTKKTNGIQPDGSWYAANEFCAGEHGGTHLDAPYHFARDGIFAGDITLDKLILPLIVADVSDKVRGDPNFVLQKHHLDYMLNNYFGRVEQPCLVIFKFGWSKYYSDRLKYLGITADDGKLNFPGVSGEVAQWITQSYKNIVGVGVDTASVDPGASTEFAAHKILLGAGLYVLENVKLDQYIPDAACTALIMPMKIAKGTGAPLRVAAVCPKDRMNQTVLLPHRL